MNKHKGCKISHYPRVFRDVSSPWHLNFTISMTFCPFTLPSCKITREKKIVGLSSKWSTGLVRQYWPIQLWGWTQWWRESNNSAHSWVYLLCRIPFNSLKIHNISWDTNKNKQYQAFLTKVTCKNNSQASTPHPISPQKSKRLMFVLPLLLLGVRVTWARTPLVFSLAFSLCLSLATATMSNRKLPHILTPSWWACSPGFWIRGNKPEFSYIVSEYN